MSRSRLKLHRELLLDGWKAELGGRHLRLTHPGVKGYIVASLTPSDGRAIQNAHAMMRKAEQTGVAPGYRETKNER